MKILALSLGRGVSGFLGLAFLSFASYYLDSRSFVALTLTWSIYFTASAVTTGLGLQISKALGSGYKLTKSSTLADHGFMVLLVLSVAIGLASAVGINSLLPMGPEDSIGIFLCYTFSGVLLVFQTFLVVSLLFHRKFLLVSLLVITDALLRFVALLVAQIFSLGSTFELCSVAAGPLVGGLLGILWSRNWKNEEDAQQSFSIRVRELFETSFFFSLATMGLTGIFALLTRQFDPTQVGGAVLLFLLTRGLVALPATANQNVLISDFSANHRLANSSSKLTFLLVISFAIAASLAFSLLDHVDQWAILGFDSSPSVVDISLTLFAVLANTVLYIYSLRILSIWGSKIFQALWAVTVVVFVSVILSLEFSSYSLAAAIAISSIVALVAFTLLEVGRKLK